MPTRTPYYPLSRLQNDVNRLFEGFFEDVPLIRPYGLDYPALNAWEDGDAVNLEAELPGVRKESLDISVTGQEVTISGERTIEEPKDAQYHRRERAQGRFTRSLTLPWEIDADKVEASLHDGILTVKLPKSASAKPRKIAVQTA